MALSAVVVEVVLNLVVELFLGDTVGLVQLVLQRLELDGRVAAHDHVDGGLEVRRQAGDGAVGAGVVVSPTLRALQVDTRLLLTQGRGDESANGRRAAHRVMRLAFESELQLAREGRDLHGAGARPAATAALVLGQAVAQDGVLLKGLHDVGGRVLEVGELFVVELEVVGEPLPGRRAVRRLAATRAARSEGGLCITAGTGHKSAHEFRGMLRARVVPEKSGARMPRCEQLCARRRHC